MDLTPTGLDLATETSTVSFDGWSSFASAWQVSRNMLLQNQAANDLCQTQPEEYSDFRYYLATGFATWESLIGDQWTCGGGTMVYDPAMGICYGQGSTRLAETAWNFSFF